MADKNLKLLVDITNTIPGGNENFTTELLENYYNEGSIPPNDISDWMNIYDTVQKYLKYPEFEWEYKVLSLVTKVYVEELKAMPRAL